MTTSTKTVRVKVLHESSIPGARWVELIDVEPTNEIDGAEYADGSWWDETEEVAGTICFADFSGIEFNEQLPAPTVDVALSDLRVASCGDCRVIGAVTIDDCEPKITLEICDNHEWLGLYGNVRDRNDDELDVESMREFRSLLETEIEKRLPQADCVRPRNGRTICHQWNGAHFTHKIGPVGTFANLTDLQVVAINEAVDVAMEWAKSLGEPLRSVVVTYTDGRTENYANYEAALDSLGAEYGADMIAEHDGDLTEDGDRTLVWASELASVNDDGAKAVASIRWAE